MMPFRTLTIFRRAAFLALVTGCLVTPKAAVDEGEIDWSTARDFWAFQAPLASSPPRVKNSRWPQQLPDYFVLAELEKKGLQPSHPAEKRTLIRRVTYDLTGLPPTPEETAAFLKDRKSDATKRLVDRLLESPAFGERMASLWLPLARYAEDQAHQVGQDTKFFYPNAYKYREWVINAFNRDLPYNQFIKLQLAADKLGCTNDFAALGFIGLGPKYYDRQSLSVMADEWEDRVDTVSRTFLGLTVACARCHDHKFDPITRADYYGMAGIFASTKMVNKKADGSEEKEEKADKWEPTSLHMIEDGEVKDLNIFLRGNVERKGPVAPRQFLRVLAHDPAQHFSDGSGRRELAEAIADPQNPLTARVIVNRIWGMLIGKPIVETPSNFGHSGMAPSNQALLDALAIQFVNSGWSIKTLVREIVLSATYQQRSASNVQGESVDASNQYNWRMNRRRLSVEQFRDSVLALSGQLECGGGKSLELEDPANKRRTVYARISRLQLNNLLMQFDYPDANVHAEKRSTTTTAIQKLYELNSPFMLDAARAFAERIQAADKTDRLRVTRAYEWVFGREPDRNELKLAAEFLQKPAPGELTRWQEYAQALLISNEFFYVD